MNKSSEQTYEMSINAEYKVTGEDGIRARMNIDYFNLDKERLLYIEERFIVGGIQNLIDGAKEENVA